MKAVVTLSVLGGLVALPVLGIHGARAQLIPGLSGPGVTTTLPSGGNLTASTTSTTMPGRVPAGPLGGAPVAAPSGNVGKTIRLGNPRTRANQLPEEDPGDMAPAGEAELGTDDLGQGIEGGGHPDAPDQPALDQLPHGAAEEPDDGDEGATLDDLEEEWGDDGEDAE
jgi:hypothetical protein